MGFIVGHMVCPVTLQQWDQTTEQGSEEIRAKGGTFWSGMKENTHLALLVFHIHNVTEVFLSSTPTL